MRQITFRQLRAILAVNRLGKINLAASELGLTASAVTLQIQQAEAETGRLAVRSHARGLSRH